MSIIEWLLWAALVVYWFRDYGLPVRLASIAAGVLLLIALLLALFHGFRNV